MAEPFKTPMYQNGVVREAAVDQTLVPQDAVEMAINVHFDRIGAVITRPGITQLGASLGSGAVLGMGNYRNNAGTVFAALAKSDTLVKAYTGSSWDTVRSGLSSTTKARFTNLVDYAFMVDGNSAAGGSALQTWGGSGSFGTTNDGDLPRGDFIENYRNRIWVGDKSTDKLYYTDVVTTSGTITGGTSFLQISPADGESMTALKRHPRALLVFKQNHIYRVFSPNSSDPDPSILRGTYSQESVVEAKDGIYYHHPTGFYKFVFDGDQEEISRPLIDVIKAIPRSAYENISGWTDEDHVMWSIGDVTLGGINFTNLICRRTISTKVWTIYSYPTEFRCSTLYDDGSNIVNLLGGQNGSTYKFDTGTDDAGTAIFYDLVTHWMYITENRNLLKNLSKIAVLSENATGAMVSYQLDTDGQGASDWRQSRTIEKALYDVVSLDAKNFTRIRLRMSGSGATTAAIFRGFEGLDLTYSQPE